MKARLCALLLAFNLGCNHARTDVDPRLKTFATQKWQETKDLAANLHLRVPRETRKLFKAAEAGDWITVSNQFARIRPLSGQYWDSRSDPAFQNVLWIPVQETDSAYALFNIWDPRMLENYAKSILAVMPSGSVYFGGTDPGRFAITFFRDVANSPDIFVITQNGLADARYADYLLLRYGTRLRLPSNADVQSAFEKFVAESGSRPRLPDEQITVKNGAMHVSGAASVMEINGILTKQIFENNKAQHEFYIEESYVIPWMYPYLEPHGPILKLNRQPLPQLDPAVAEKDRSFWSALAVNLSTSPTGQRTDEAHKVYAKLRSAIGGVYAYRHMASEAEAAFKQAAEIAPTLPEASFRLAQLYCETGRFDDAEATLEQFQARLPAPDSNTTEAIRQVRDLKLKAGKKQSQ